MDEERTYENEVVIWCILLFNQHDLGEEGCLMLLIVIVGDHCSSLTMCTHRVVAADGQGDSGRSRRNPDDPIIHLQAQRTNQSHCRSCPSLQCVDDRKERWWCI